MLLYPLVAMKATMATEAMTKVAVAVAATETTTAAGTDNTTINYKQNGHS
jgi:hypothetical protein